MIGFWGATLWTVIIGAAVVWAYHNWPDATSNLLAVMFVLITAGMWCIALFA